MITKAEKIKTWTLDIIAFIVGSVLLAFSVQYFSAPNNISVGGVTGIATMANFLVGGKLQIGTLVLILNLPLFIACRVILGRSFFVKTLWGTVISALMMNIFDWVHLPVYHDNMLLAAIFGGVIGGAGIGLIFLRGGTTGGIDIASRLIKTKIPHYEIGKIMLVLEALILICTTFVYKNIDNALYSVISIYTSSVAIDTILYGIDNGKTLIIISDGGRKISKRIMDEMGRGVTLLKGEGAYTEEEKDVVMTAIRRQDMFKARQIVHEEDPKAFIIVCETSETIGLGFKSILDNK